MNYELELDFSDFFGILIYLCSTSPNPEFVLLVPTMALVFYQKPVTKPYFD